MLTSDTKFLLLLLANKRYETRSNPVSLLDIQKANV